MHSACCHTIKSRSCLRKTTLLSMAPSCLSAVGLPVVHRRAYSLEPASSGSGRTKLGSFSQQHSVERSSPSSALTQRNLSAVAVQVGRCLWVYLVLKYSLQLNLFSEFAMKLVEFSILCKVLRLFKKYKLVWKLRMHVYLFTNPVFRDSVVCVGLTSWTSER